MPTINRDDIQVRWEYDEDPDVSWMDDEALEQWRQGDIEIFFVWAEVQVVFKETVQIFRSGGVGGVSVETGDTDYLEEIGEEEVDQLIGELEAAGIRVNERTPPLRSRRAAPKSKRRRKR